MQDHNVIAIYFYERFPADPREKLIYEHEELLKFSETRKDADLWAYEYAEKQIQRNSQKEPMSIDDYMEVHFRYVEKPLSECLDTLIELQSKVKSLDSRVSTLEHVLCMKDGFSRRLDSRL